MGTPSTTQPSLSSETLPGKAWQALVSNPHRFVVVSFGLAIVLLLLILWRGLLLAQGREIDSLRQMQTLRAQSMNAQLQLEAERLLSVRNYAEHLLQIQTTVRVRPDAELQSAFARRNEDVWTVPTHDEAAVYGIGPGPMAALDGFSRNDAELLSGMIVARLVGHLVSAAPKGPGLRRRVIYVSTNGLLVVRPPIPEREVNAALHRFAAAPYVHDNLPSHNPDRNMQWHIAPASGDSSGLSLFLSVPVYSGKTFRAVAVLEIPQRSLDDHLSQAPFHDVSSYLVDREGRLVGASTRNVRRGETLQAALSGNWTPGTLATIFNADTGVLSDGDGHRLMFRRIGNGGLALVDEVPTKTLLLASAGRLSGVVGSAAAALGILLCAMLAVVHTLFGHYLERGEALRTLAETDALTGLANRRVFAARFAAEQARCTAQGLPISVIMLDIDHFKRINDHWGHATGDIVLRAVSTVLRGNVRQSDLPARLGGEEFAVLLPGTGTDDAAAVAEQLRQVLQGLSCEPAPDAMNKDEVRFTASFGVAEVRPGMAESLDSVLMAADQRLYQAKSSGRNRVIAG
jgi:diguanylate cyclase (GGDEF)-like protein